MVKTDVKGKWYLEIKSRKEGHIIGNNVYHLFFHP